jgi:hypothetical protein
VLKKLKMYKPLPHGLFIEESGINGQGLYTNAKLAEGTNLGMSHVELGKLMLRTPMGGFINHSSKPNCVKVKSLLTRQQWNSLNDLPKDKYDHDFPRWDLVTIKDIEEGEELTVHYTFYTI